MYKSVIKRLFDFTLSLIAIIVMLPLFALIGIIIYIDDPGPVFFRQERMGKDKKMFRIYKFRSMKMNTPQIPGYRLDNADMYITGVGHIIRKLSIDELPQIFNILLGHMSIVGYRPSLFENEEELVNERDKYSVHKVRPGLTGWAQINGRDEITIETKAAFDAEYVEVLNCGGMKAFRMDVKCFLYTIPKVLRHKGVVEGKIKFDIEKKSEVVHK